MNLKTLLFVVLSLLFFSSLAFSEEYFIITGTQRNLLIQNEENTLNRINSMNERLTIMDSELENWKLKSAQAETLSLEKEKVWELRLSEYRQIADQAYKYSLTLERKVTFYRSTTLLLLFSGVVYAIFK